MKIKRFPVLLTAFSAVLILGSCTKEEMKSASQKDVQSSQSSRLKSGGPGSDGSSINGQGSLTIDGKLRTFAFHGRKKTDGSVSGSFELHNRSTGSVMHGDVICLNVYGSEANATAVLTKVPDDYAPWDEGDYVVFKVVDNGEGSNAAPDQLTLVYLYNDVNIDCNYYYPFPLNDIEGGNIQVKE